MLAQIQWYSVLKSIAEKIILKVDGTLCNWPHRNKEYNPFQWKQNQSLMKALIFRESNGKFQPSTFLYITIYESVDNPTSHLQ